VRGWQNINDTTLGKVYYGNDTCALGIADNQVVSLGDSGYAIVSFDNPIFDGEGFDFAVFENAFNDEFLELAFVEVSSDSVHWARFPSISLTDTTEQVGTFGTLQPEKIHNLAGKYRVLYGTPFDLSELPETPNVDVNNIKYIKIIDVIGSVKTDKYSIDSQGNKINDPYPTEFYSGGFDLDAVGAINVLQPNNLISKNNKIEIYPNPAKKYFYIHSNKNIKNISVYDIYGTELLNRKIYSKTDKINIENLPKGFYLIKINEKYVYKFIKQ
jgi:hypothetical protein